MNFNPDKLCVLRKCSRRQLRNPERQLSGYKGYALREDYESSWKENDYSLPKGGNDYKSGNDYRLQKGGNDNGLQKSGNGNNRFSSSHDIWHTYIV